MGYKALYVRNEHMHELTDEKLRGLIIEETGEEQDSRVVTLVVSCIKAIKKYAKPATEPAEEPTPLNQQPSRKSEIQQWIFASFRNPVCRAHSEGLRQHGPARSLAELAFVPRSGRATTMRALIIGAVLSTLHFSPSKGAPTSRFDGTSVASVATNAR